MDNFKKYSDRIVKGSFLFIIISGIIFNVIFFLTGRELVGVSVIVITTLFLLAYTYSEKLFKEKLYFVPAGFYYVAIIFAFFSVYLGSFLNFYEKFALWDDILHFTSGVLLAVLCVILTSFIVIKRFGIIDKKMDILFMVIVGVLISISLAVFWEFYEFSFDYLFDGNMQRGVIVTDLATYDPTQYMRPSGRIVGLDLLDTMSDFFKAVTGAILAGVYCYYHYANISKNIDNYKIDETKIKENIEHKNNKRK